MATKRGLSYPITVENGSLKLSEDADLVAEHIYSTLETRPTERVMRPRYGTPNYVFEAVGSAQLIPRRLEVALRDQVSEPESFALTGNYQEEGILMVEVRYTLNSVPQPPIQFKLKA